jgi:hypothetical protein
MRSVVVVLPASIWAAMPIFLIRSSGTVLAIKIKSLSAFSSQLSAFALCPFELRADG